MQDSIQRKIAIKAPKERVYAAITDPKQIVKWFPDGIEGNLDAGERPILDFGEYGKNQIYVEAARPYEYFAYRWVPGSSHVMGDVLTMPNTLVEFRIVEANGVSTVTLRESGFASLPVENREERLKQNTGGWEYMMNRLEAYFSQE